MNRWSFVTNHARALLAVADQPDARLRDLAAILRVTERTAFGIITDLIEAGYVVKERRGRRNRYHVQEHRRLPADINQRLTIGEVLDLLVDADGRPASERCASADEHSPGDATPEGDASVGDSPTH